MCGRRLWIPGARSEQGRVLPGAVDVVSEFRMCVRDDRARLGRSCDRDRTKDEEESAGRIIRSASEEKKAQQ